MSTGSIIGTIDGLAQGAKTYSSGAGALPIPAGVINAVIANPNDIVTAQTGSDVVFDVVSRHYYMALGQNGSTWIRLGSVAAS